MCKSWKGLSSHCDDKRTLPLTLLFLLHLLRTGFIVSGIIMRATLRMATDSHRTSVCTCSVTAMPVVSEILDLASGVLLRIRKLREP